jgi:hypothetical protein
MRRKTFVVLGCIGLLCSPGNRIFGEETDTSWQAEVDDGSRIWRCPENGGINVLYCYLRVNDLKCEYADLLREESNIIGNGNCSLLTLAELSSKHAVRLRPVSLTVDELFACPKPVVVHMDGRRPDVGAFLLVLDVNGLVVHFLNGPSATIHELPLEDFRRVWSGYALLPGVNSAKDEFLGLLGMAVGLAFSLLIRSGRLTNRPST